MNTVKSSIFFALIFISYNCLNAQVSEDFQIFANDSVVNESIMKVGGNNGSQSIVFIRKSNGKLKIYSTTSEPITTVYFHIPIYYPNQVPLSYKVYSKNLLNFKMMHTRGNNYLGVATLKTSEFDTLNWEVYTLNKVDLGLKRPKDIPFTELENLPDSVTQWLAATDQVQINDTFIIQKAIEARDTITDIIRFADAVVQYILKEVPFPRTNPVFCTLDAFYALKWGGACTSHSHATSALFRNNGIPSRSLLNLPTGENYAFHWINDYYIPNYGWALMEQGRNFFSIGGTAICYVNYPEDEFPVLQFRGIDNQFTTSDIKVYCGWGLSHNGSCSKSWILNNSKADSIYSISNKVYQLYANVVGRNLTPEQNQIIDSVERNQFLSINCLELKKIDSIYIYKQNALELLNKFDINTIDTIYYEDFENGSNGWTHGGINDEWEFGTPAYNNITAHSGQNCWGTDLDNTYNNSTDSWLLSPPIQIPDVADATFSFSVFNDIEDEPDTNKFDYLCMEITLDGGLKFIPFCSYMVGKLDYKEIPQTGGWSKVYLDLTPYSDQTVQFRYRFVADSSNNYDGSYIDDIMITGRNIGIRTGYNDIEQNNDLLYQNTPNPFSNSTEIEYYIEKDGLVQIDIYNSEAKRLDRIFNNKQNSGLHSITWNPSNLPNGLYFYKITTSSGNQIKKCIHFNN